MTGEPVSTPRSRRIPPREAMIIEEVDGMILTFIETRDKKTKKSSLERAVRGPANGRRAQDRGDRRSRWGRGWTGLAAELASYGASKVYLLENVIA